MSHALDPRVALAWLPEVMHCEPEAIRVLDTMAEFDADPLGAAYEHACALEDLANALHTRHLTHRLHAPEAQRRAVDAFRTRFHAGVDTPDDRRIMVYFLHGLACIEEWEGSCTRGLAAVEEAITMHRRQMATAEYPPSAGQEWLAHLLHSRASLYEAQARTAAAGEPAT